MARLHIGGMVVALALVAIPSAAMAQARPAAPGPSPDLQALLKKAEAGDPAPLTKKADAGDAEAQYYAGLLYAFGGSKVAKNPARGCGYAQKASARRADAMHLVGMCYQGGGFGAVDKAKAEQAFSRAAAMGFAKSKCALGRLVMSEPGRGAEGLAHCLESAKAGDVDAQVFVGDTYFAGGPVKKDLAAARKWYDLAAKQNNTHAARRLGEMYARGDGGTKDKKKAMELWRAAEKAGDPLVAILVADQLFSDMTGGRTPGPGRYAFKNAVPIADIKVVEEWYQLAESRDPRPDVKTRAKYALAILKGLRTGTQTVKK